MGWRDWRNRGGSSGRNTGGGSSRPRSSTRSTTASNAGYSPATSAGRSSTSPGYGQYNTSAASAYWGDPNYTVSTARTTPSGRTLNSGYYQGTNEGYQAFRQSYDPSGGLSGLPAGPGYSGGGGGGYGGGGGGGGGGGPAMTQAMFDAMLQALGTRGPQLALNQVNLPDFKGTNIPAFNASPYEQLRKQLAQAVQRDTGAINQGATQTTNALAAYNANPYNTAAAVAPVAEQQGAAMAGGAGGANAEAANAAQQSANAETGAFNDLMKVLGANYNQAQNSRMSQVQQTAQAARNQLGAQNLGLGAQIGMQRNQAFEQWRQADAERRYQNSLMGQQWNREELTRNQDIANQQAQGNWQQRNEMISGRLAPLLQLIQSTAGANINMSALQKMLAGLAR